jgi:hypothetical protein
VENRTHAGGASLCLELAGDEYVFVVESRFCRIHRMEDIAWFRVPVGSSQPRAMLDERKEP